MEFAEFLERVDAKPADVARETGRHPSTIGRIRDKGQRPDGDTLLAIQEWADRLALKLELDASEWLTWDYLREPEPAEVAP